MTRDELLSRLEHQAADAEAMQASAPVATVLRTVLDEVRALEETNGAEPDRPDTMLNVKEAGRRLGMSARWVYKNANALPFARRYPSGALRFSERGLERWLSRRRT